MSLGNGFDGFDRVDGETGTVEKPTHAGFLQSTSVPSAKTPPEIGMRMTVVAAVGAAALVVNVGCGGGYDNTGPSGNSNIPCTISITGAAAIAGTYSCLSTPITVWVPSTNSTAVNVSSPGTKSIIGLFVFAGKPAGGATYSSVNSAGLQSYGFIVNVGNASWEFSAGQQAAPLGSGTLTFTTVAPLAANANGSVYDAHGTMDANLVPSPGTTATGNATLHVVF
jgi:hypothetical protein